MLGPINRNPDEKTLRQFGWIMLGGCGVLGFLLGWLRLPAEGRWTWSSPGLQGAILLLWTAGAATFVASRASLEWTRALYVGWMRATRPVGVAVFTVGLTLMFLTVLPVFSLIIRLSDPLRRTLRSSGSYWEDVKPYDPTPRRMARPF